MTNIVDTQTSLYADGHRASWNRRTSFSKQRPETLHPTLQPITTMCRQFYRYCRDCHEMFQMPEHEMREPCKAFQAAQIVIPCLERCPEKEIQAIRPSSGHGVKVCGACRIKNRAQQRYRENAQKRARRAKLKQQKMTAGIGAGNVVWTAPNIWRPSVMDTQIWALQSPQPQRPLRCNILKVRSTTQALQYALNGSISMATMMQDDVDVSHDERVVYSQSCQTFATTTSSVLQPQGNSNDMTVSEMHDDANLHYQRKTEPPSLSTKPLDVPSFQEQKRQPVGLGITMNNDTERDQKHTEACPFDESGFQMELNKWSTVFDDDDDGDGDNHDDAKELWRRTEDVGMES